MHQSNITLLNLPYEILLIILKKLNNIDILYALLDVGNQRLDMIVMEKTFTETLNFVSTTAYGDNLPIPGSIIDRFCINILRRIHQNIKYLILESESMERILLAAEYPNLTKLKLFNVNDYIISHYFTDESSFQHIFQQQITDLILVYKWDVNVLLTDKNPEYVYEYTLKYFAKLERLSIIGSAPILTIHNLSLATYSSNIYKLCLTVRCFEDCFALLDGRFKQLTALSVKIIATDNYSSIVYNMNALPKMKYFSLECSHSTNAYVAQVLPLLRRMTNLEELSLNIIHEERSSFIDGTQINEQILVHMPRLYKFTFYISSHTTLNHVINHTSNDDIQRTFTNIGYQKVCCFLNRTLDGVICHVFSLPFAFDYLACIGNTFPPIYFCHVTMLNVHDIVPLKHEFFVRLARFFPLLQILNVFNFTSQSRVLHGFSGSDNQLQSIVEYPYLISLDLRYSHTDYVEQFLNEKKTQLPRLTKLIVDYNQLKIVTKNFTRDTTRLNCSKVQELTIEETLVHSKDFYGYFPLL